MVGTSSGIASNSAHSSPLSACCAHPIHKRFPLFDNMSYFIFIYIKYIYSFVFTRKQFSLSSVKQEGCLHKKFSTPRRAPPFMSACFKHQSKTWQPWDRLVLQSSLQVPLQGWPTSRGKHRTAKAHSSFIALCLLCTGAFTCMNTFPFLLWKDCLCVSALAYRNMALCSL